MIQFKHTITTKMKTIRKITTRKEVGRLIWSLALGLVILANTQKFQAPKGNASTDRVILHTTNDFTISERPQSLVTQQIDAARNLSPNPSRITLTKNSL
ncbi:hypothetical protein BKI52_25285 [marine bacterium AO1-C]|nr:hypothetical protein BKI52_25285 [marine bacterium AO1-C]